MPPSSDHGAVQTGAGPTHQLSPEVLAASAPGRVIFLNGTTCSGKTTTAKALQSTLDGVWIRMGIDDFNLKLRELRSTLSEANSDQEIDGLAVHQRLVLGFHRAAAGYASAGNNVIVDHVLGEDWRLDDCLTVFAPFEVTFVGVRCSLPELERRERERSSRRAGSAARQFPLVHAHGVYDVEVATDELTPAQCAERIGRQLTRRDGATAFAPVADGPHQGVKHLTSTGPRSELVPCRIRVRCPVARERKCMMRGLVNLTITFQITRTNAPLTPTGIGRP